MVRGRLIAGALAAAIAAPLAADGPGVPPGWTRIAGIPEVDLNTEPGPAGDVVAILPEGTRVRLLACQGSGSQRWCRVETSSRLTGWVYARFLRTDPPD